MRNRAGRVAKEIARARSRLDLSREQFAARLGVSARSVARWEAGHAVPRSRHQRVAIAQVLEPAGVDDALRRALDLPGSSSPAIAAAAREAMNVDPRLVDGPAASAATGRLVDELSSIRAELERVLDRVRVLQRAARTGGENE